MICCTADGSYHFVFQISLFSTLADIFAYAETPPMYQLVYQNSPAETRNLVEGNQKQEI